MNQRQVSTLLILVAVASAIFASAQSGVSPASRAATGPAAGSEIRRVDFGNFTYGSDCGKSYSNSGFPQEIHILAGAWKQGSGYDAVYFTADKAIYGDLAGDGKDEAVVRTSCGFEMNTQHHDEVFVFSMAVGRPVLVVRFSSADLNAPSPDFVWAITKVQVRDQKLAISYLAGGPRAQPAWDTTARFKWNGHRLVRLDVARKPFRP
jgi:hypothetical protein